MHRPHEYLCIFHIGDHRNLRRLDPRTKYIRRKLLFSTISDRNSIMSKPRRANQLREISVQRHFTNKTPGSVLFSAGNTIVLCTASVQESVPPWMEGKGKGWITAEYNMLPSSTSPRKRRDRTKVDGRTTEIQRLIGRSIRAVADLEALGERSIAIDCDVLQADGGTRTASITGAYIAVMDAIDSFKDELPNPKRSPLRDSLAAVSVGIVHGKAYLDLDYELDFAADVDMNVVMTETGKIIEIQGTAEEDPFSHEELLSMLELAKHSIREINDVQKTALS